MSNNATHLFLSNLVERAVARLLCKTDISDLVAELLEVDAPDTGVGVAAARHLQAALERELTPLARGCQAVADAAGGLSSPDCPMGYADRLVWAKRLGNAELAYEPDPGEMASHAVTRYAHGPADHLSRFPAGPTWGSVDAAGPFIVCAACLMEECSPVECLSWHATVAYGDALTFAAVNGGLSWPNAYGSEVPTTFADQLIDDGQVWRGAHRSTREQLVWGWLVALASHRHQMFEQALTEIEGVAVWTAPSLETPRHSPPSRVRAQGTQAP